jgi:DNA-binding GntR family transcriptional regulator
MSQILYAKSAEVKVKKKRSDELREAIEERIVIGEFGPGMRLDEAQLAQRFGASRTPLREALIQLASSGLVELRARRGAVVTEPSAEHLIEMFEVMAELEAMCGRLAARRIRPEELAQLRGAHEDCALFSDGADLDAYYYANERFHATIYAASHNSYLAEEAARLHRRLRAYRRLQLRVRDRLANSFREHAEVVAAIATGDGELAARRLREHILVQGEGFSDLVASVAMLRAA